jgi:predicted methyltransferase
MNAKITMATKKTLQGKRIVAAVVVVLVVVPVVFVVDQAVRTLRTLAVVERERDTWQRPDDILGHLNLADGNTVVDLGSGAGYFALKIAPRVAPNGRVLAVDLRRQSLAFLWIRALAGGHANLQVTLSQAAHPKLPAGPVDAVLIANTYHELTAPEPVLQALFHSMRSGARLVVVDRGPRDESRTATAAHHEMTAARAEGEIHQQGFQTIARDDRFIDRPQDDDVWWLMVFLKP